MITIDNQPIVFNLDKSCRYPVEYKQLVNQGDVTQFQFRLEVCEGSPQLLANDSFTLNLNGWTIGGSGFGYLGTGEAAKTGTTTSYLRQNVLTIGRYYRAEINVTAINSPGVNDIAQIRFGASTRYQDLQVGLNKVYGMCLGTTNFDILCTGSSTITVDSVLLYEVSLDHKVVITGDNDEYVAEVDLYNENAPYYNSDYFWIDQDFVTCKLNWNNLSVGVGCYKIAVLDPCLNTNIQTGFFNNDFHQGQYGWAIINNDITPATITWNGELNINATDTNPGDIRYLLANLSASYEYTCTYTISSISNAVFAVSYGGNFGTTRNSAGTYTETVLSSGGFLQLSWSIFGGGGGVVIEKVQIGLADTEDLTYDFLSEPLKVDNFDCTKQLKISNDVRAFGFDFTHFAPSVRVRADLVGGEDIGDRESVRNADGSNKVVWADVVFSEDLMISQQPRYIHDFLRYMAKANYFYIDEVSYFVVDETNPDIAWNKQRSLGTITYQVSENRLQLNQNCEGTTTGGNSGSTGIGGGSSSGGGSHSDAGGASIGVAIGLSDGSILGID